MTEDSDDMNASEAHTNDGRSSHSSILDEGNEGTSSISARVEPTQTECLVGNMDQNNSSSSQVIKNADGSGTDFVPFVGYDFKADGGIEDYLNEEDSATKSGGISNTNTGEYSMDKIDEILNSIAGMTGKKRNSMSHSTDQIKDAEEKATRENMFNNKMHDTKVDQKDEPECVVAYQEQGKDDNESETFKVAIPEQESIKMLEVVEDLQLDFKTNETLLSNHQTGSTSAIIDTPQENIPTIKKLEVVEDTQLDIKTNQTLLSKDQTGSASEIIDTPQEDNPATEVDGPLSIDEEVQAAGQSTDPYTPTRAEQHESLSNPDEWTTHWSQDHGCNYYHNTSTGEVTWEDPFKEKVEYIDEDYAPIADFTKEKVTDTTIDTIDEEDVLNEGRRSMAADLAYQRKKKLNKKRMRKKILKRAKTVGSLLFACFVFYFLWRFGVKNKVDEKSVTVHGDNVHLKGDNPQETREVNQEAIKNSLTLDGITSEGKESNAASTGTLRQTDGEESHFEAQNEEVEVQRSGESHDAYIQNNKDDSAIEDEIQQKEEVPSTQDSNEAKEEGTYLGQKSKHSMDDKEEKSSSVEEITLESEHHETFPESKSDDAEIGVLAVTNGIEVPTYSDATPEEVVVPQAEVVTISQAEEAYVDETDKLAKELGMKLEESVALLRSSTAPDGSYESEDLDRLGSKLDELRAILHEVKGDEDGIKEDKKGIIPDEVIEPNLTEELKAESGHNTITSTTPKDIMDDSLTETVGMQGENEEAVADDPEIIAAVEKLSKLQSLLETVEDNPDDSVIHADTQKDNSEGSTDDSEEFIINEESNDPEIIAAVEKLSKLNSLLETVEDDSKNDKSEGSKDDGEKFIRTEDIDIEKEMDQETSEEDSSKVDADREIYDHAEQNENLDQKEDMVKLGEYTDDQLSVAKPQSDLESDDNMDDMLSTFSSSVHELKLESMRRNLGKMKSSLAEDIGKERLETMQSAIKVIKRAMIDTIEDDIIELSDSLGLSALENKQGFDEVADVISELTDVISDRRKRRYYALNSMRNTLSVVKDTVANVSRKAVPSAPRMRTVSSLSEKESLGSRRLFDKPEILFQRPISNEGDDDRISSVFSRRTQDRTRVSNLFNQMPESDDTTTRSLVFLDTRRIHCHFPIFHSMNAQCGDEVSTFRPQRLLSTLDPKLLLSASQEKRNTSWNPQNALVPFNKNHNIIGMRRMALRGFKEFTQACSKARELIPKKLGMVRSRVTEILSDNKMEDEDRRNLVCSIPLLHLVSKESERECKKRKKDSTFDIKIMLDNTAL